jgi:methylated-DNA-[protein]-cysteine S-methyltransferase
MGPLHAACTALGLVMLSYGDAPLEGRLDRLAREVSPRILESPARLDPVRRELEEYFAGRRRRFDVPIDWSLARGYALEVLRRTAEIPYGESSTYAEIAYRAGSPRGWRAAGNALGSNPMPIVVPCHRVMATGGGLGGYTGGLDRKRFLLALEGVEPERARR